MPIQVKEDDKTGASCIEPMGIASLFSKEIFSIGLLGDAVVPQVCARAVFLVLPTTIFVRLGADLP